MSNTQNDSTFLPIISSIQKVALYETKNRIYLVGSNNKENRFRILEIDRTQSDVLNLFEHPEEKEAKNIRKFVNSLNYTKTISAYGIVGFVKFLEGYYLILVTKRTRCAVIGMHMIYTIKDTVMIKVNESTNKQPHSLEQRYVKMFSNIDLKSNFYFSYSYDLTRTLQYNTSEPRSIGMTIGEDEDRLNWNSSSSEKSDRKEYAFRSISRKRFVWNLFLLTPMQNILHKDWMIEIIHGFVTQSNISIFGRPVYVCLVARRSTRFAGTRFLKRGANFSGDVANEVETEQIVMDGTSMCSFTQMRGSIPSHWSQDISKMVPKPAISLDLADPFSETSGKHFQRLLFHHGAPIIVLNLVKKREKRKHESILSKEMVKSVRYLNQFLPPQFRIKYIHFDMARKSRGGGNVMESLATISENVIQQNGLFFFDGIDTTYQTGIVRVNCVDCLDRTNTAQFAIGKCALSHQLNRLGFIKPAKLEFDSDCVTMLESLYEDHGDTLALQYGGSQLVHRIKTYRKTAAWTSQGNDIMQTLSRYYSNTFSDTEKQHSINLFLGYYKPYENLLKHNSAIWELPTDYYMHNLQSFAKENLCPITEWVNPKILKYLPNSCSCLNKVVRELIRIHSKDLEMIDSYSNYYLPYKLTVFEDNIAYQISLLARNFMPTFRTNFSPFEPGRRREGRANNKNPSLTGQSSTSSTTSSTSSSVDENETSSDDEQLFPINSVIDNNIKENTTANKINSMFPSMLEVYDTNLEPPSKPNLNIYKRYVQVGKVSSFSQNKNLKSFISHENNRSVIEPLTIFDDSSYKNYNLDINQIDYYKQYSDSHTNIFNKINEKTNECIMKYVNFKI